MIHRKLTHGWRREENVLVQQCHGDLFTVELIGTSPMAVCPRTERNTICFVALLGWEAKQCRSLSDGARVARSFTLDPFLRAVTTCRRGALMGCMTFPITLELKKASKSENPAIIDSVSFDVSVRLPGPSQVLECFTLTFS
jgi:hypothetical protein